MKKLLAKFLLGRGVGKAQEALSKLIRHGVTSLGGALGGMGYMTGDDTTALSGALVVVGSVVVSVARAVLADKMASYLSK